MSLLLLLDNEFVVSLEDVQSEIEIAEFLVFVSPDEVIPLGVAIEEGVEVYVSSDENFPVAIKIDDETFTVNVNMDETFPVKIASDERTDVFVTLEELFFLNKDEKIPMSRRRITNPKELNL